MNLTERTGDWLAIIFIVLLLLGTAAYVVNDNNPVPDNSASYM